MFDFIHTQLVFKYPSLIPRVNSPDSRCSMEATMPMPENGNHLEYVRITQKHFKQMKPGNVLSNMLSSLKKQHKTKWSTFQKEQLCIFLVLHGCLCCSAKPMCSKCNRTFNFIICRIYLFTRSLLISNA